MIIHLSLTDYSLIEKSKYEWHNCLEPSLVGVWIPSTLDMPNLFGLYFLQKAKAKCLWSRHLPDLLQCSCTIHIMNFYEWISSECKMNDWRKCNKFIIVTFFKLLTWRPISKHLLSFQRFIFWISLNEYIFNHSYFIFERWKYSHDKNDTDSYDISTMEIGSLWQSKTYL